MMRHVLGEALQRRPRVLNWGPSSNYHPASVLRESRITESLNRLDPLLRYNPRSVWIPVKSCRASPSCCVCAEQDYPEDTGRLRTGPPWDLPDSEMGQRAGSSRWVRLIPGTVCRFQSPQNCRTTKTTPFSGIGANEYIMDVTHDRLTSSRADGTPTLCMN